MNSEIEKRKNFFIRPQGLIFLTLIMLVLGIIALNVFFKSSKQNERSILHQKNDFTLFLENIMIREGGLYTLIGTKPITEFDIEGTIEETEEDLQKSYEELKNFNPYNTSIPTYETYRLKCIKNRESLKSLNHRKLWQEYKKINVNLDPKFRIFYRKNPFSEESIGIFVNIPNLVYVLYRYQSEFSKRTHLEYDPNEIILELEDETSIFWEKVFQDHLLSGLIYGYGERSSYLYDWSSNHLTTAHEERTQFFSNEDHLKKVANLVVKSNIQVSDLPVPEFFHFGITDGKKIEYEWEREKIISFFQNKDFTKTTLSILFVNEVID